MTAPLIETILTFLDHYAGAMERILAIFSHLYQQGHDAEMIAVLRILYDILGLQFPEDADLLTGHPKTRQFLLFSFLMDMEDCVQEFMVGFTVE